MSTEAEVLQEGWTAARNAADNADLNPAQPRSVEWEIENPRIQCRLLTLSSSANQEFDKLLNTSGILINAKSYLTLQQSLTGATNRVNFFASKSNIEALFVTFPGPAKYTPRRTHRRITEPSPSKKIIELNLKTYKEVNSFMHPNFYFLDGNGSDAQRAAKQNFTVRQTVGSKITPEHAIESPQESLYNLITPGARTDRDA